MTKYVLTKKEKEITGVLMSGRKNIVAVSEKMRPGCTIFEEETIIATYETREDGLKALAKKESSLKTYVSNKIVEVAEYWLQEAEVNEDGEIEEYSGNDDVSAWQREMTWDGTDYRWNVNLEMWEEADED